VAPDTVVAVPVYGQLDLVRRCLTAIDRQTPADVGLLVIDDHGPERLTDNGVAELLDSNRAWRFVSHRDNVGFVGSVNEAFDTTGRADVVVVNSDVEVLPGWFEALTGAANSRADVASISSLADNGGILSVPALAGHDLTPGEWAMVRAALPAVAEIPVAVAHCTLFTRAALDTIGGFDLAFAPGYGEEVDWSLRASRRGMHHLASLHSYVLHAQSASFGRAEGLFSLQRRHELRLLARYRRQWFAIRAFARRTDSGLAAGLAAVDSELSRLRDTR
jgi:GT2 family glycosyltransferase